MGTTGWQPKAKVTEPIPVRYFEGTPAEAVLESARANSKTKLPMSNGERQDSAWRFVLLGVHSKSEIVDAAGVSDGQVGNMRRVQKALGDSAATYTRWWEASRVAGGADIQEFDDDAAEALATSYADRLSKVFGKKLPNNTTIAARPLSIYFGRRLPDLVWDLREYVPEDEEDEDADF